MVISLSALHITYALNLLWIRTIEDDLCVRSTIMAVEACRVVKKLIYISNIKIEWMVGFTAGTLSSFFLNGIMFRSPQAKLNKNLANIDKTRGWLQTNQDVIHIIPPRKSLNEIQNVDTYTSRSKL